MNDQLTDKQFWLNYWEQKHDLVQYVSKKNPFASIFSSIFKRSSIKTCIEIGGFPGYQSIYLSKYHNLKTALLDYVIHEKKINELLIYNELNQDTINLIEADLFSYESSVKYDLCFSIGFIEHFSNTNQLLQNHLHFLNPGGTLLIIVPNFLGINGWFNKKFDRGMYDKHYLECMDSNTLGKCANSLNLINVRTFYFGKFSIWLGNYSAKNVITKSFFQICWIIGKIVSKIFPFDSRFFSPYTALIGEKGQ